MTGDDSIYIYIYMCTCVFMGVYIYVLVGRSAKAASQKALVPIQLLPAK